MKRGDVVLVTVPYLSGSQSKTRPALVIQDDTYNAKLIHTIIAAISSRVGGSMDPAYFLLDPGTPEGRQSGVHHRSIVRCDRVFTVERRDILQVIGSLSNLSMEKVDACLRRALGLQQAQ